MAELVRQALRMRVDRLVVGEFRGAEVVELLTALNTGHRGGAATVHANSVQDVPARLIALAALAGMSAPVLALQADSALDVIVQLSRSAEGVRQVTEIGLWPRFEASSGVVGQPRMVWRRGSGWSEAAGELAARIVRTGVRCPESLGVG
jgi:pilus assembly protein CpaF